MTYLDLFKLSYKKFMRRPGLSTRMIGKIFSFIGYLFFAAYMILLVVVLYLDIKKEYPATDLFVKANSYLYIYLFIVFYVMMYINFDSMEVKPFMILPVRKSKIIKFQLLKVLTMPVNLVFFSMTGLAVGLFYHSGYDMISLLFWALAVLSFTFVIELALFFSSRNTWVSVVMSLMVFVIIYKIKWLTVHLQFIGNFFVAVYKNKILVLGPVLLLGLTLAGLYFYFKKRFYLDDAIKGHKKNKVQTMNLSWTERFGITGSLIRNDLRLIWRNVRPRQSLYGFFVFYVMSFFLMSQYGGQYQPEFNKILFLMMLAGYFVLQFGTFIPAWDSEYYPLLMTQNLTYRQYIEAKWYLLSVSVILILILTLPFLFLGWQVYALLLAMSIFTLGFNMPLILYAGIFRTTPVKLNEKVKAFQTKDSFKMKTFVVSMLRIFLPIIFYIVIKKYFGFEYGVAFFVALGLLGLIFKNKLLDFIVGQYKKRKYKMLHDFKEGMK